MAVSSHGDWTTLVLLLLCRVLMNYFSHNNLGT